MPLVEVVRGYAALGGVAALAFLALGIERTMPSARGAYAFRPLLVPGLILLWPLVLWRWWMLTRRAPPVSLGRHYRAAHRRVWLLFAVLLPVALLAAMALRQEPALDPAPERLSAPLP